MKKSTFLSLLTSVLLLNSCSDSHHTNIGDIDCTINEITLTHTLKLPDCPFGSTSYNADRGNVLIIFQGEVKNTGNEAAHFITPVFKSSSGCTYKQANHIHYKSMDNDILGTKLSSGNSHQFIFFFNIPSSEIADGALEFQKNLISFDEDNTVLLPLSISKSKTVQDEVIIPNVTNL